MCGTCMMTTDAVLTQSAGAAGLAAVATVSWHQIRDRFVKPKAPDPEPAEGPADSNPVDGRAADVRPVGATVAGAADDPG